MRRREFVSLAVLFVVFLTSPISLTQAAPADPTIPVSRSDVKWWKNRFESNAERAKKGDVDLIFIGDSITHYWEREGKDVWEKYYGHRKAMNLGFSADCTQHVLWRLEHGSIDGISPKLAVVMIGTNNARDDNRPEDTAKGVQAVVESLRKKLPQTKVLLLAIFPRGANDQDPKRKLNDEVNERIVKLADDKSVFFLDIRDKLYNKDGFIGSSMLPDKLHLTRDGYQIWAEAAEPVVKRLLGE